MKFGILKRLLRSKSRHDKHKFVEIGFDPVFYYDSNPDLQHLDSPVDLYRHYVAHGRSEGRLPSRSAMISELESKYGALPPDFDPRKYVSLYPDLKRLRLTDRQAIEHFLRFGREEGRSYLVANCDLFRELYMHGQVVSDNDLIQMLKDPEFCKGKLITGADLMRSKGIEGGGRWIEDIKIDEFASLNFAWAGAIATRMGAVDAMLSNGIERLAPLSLSLDFDAE